MKRFRAAIVALAVPIVVLAGHPASASSASWEVSGCRLAKPFGSPELIADVSVKNLDPLNEHYYSVDIQFDSGDNRLGVGTTSTDWIRPLEVGNNEAYNVVVDDPSAIVSEIPEGPVDCVVTRVIDDTNELVTTPE